MKVKEIISLALTFLNKEELASFTPFGENSTVPELEAKEILNLKKCFNLVYNEIAVSYLPLVKSEDVLFINGVLPSANISKNNIQIE